MIFIFSGPHMPLGDICSGISFRYDDSIFVALAEPWVRDRARAAARGRPAAAGVPGQLVPEARHQRQAHRLPALEVMMPV